jgi:phosphoribosyl 1,2-cyclic phosphate phosphodiesterase
LSTAPPDGTDLHGDGHLARRALIAQPKDAPIDLSNPRNWRTRSSIHVVMDGLHIQVDAAQEFRLQCIREDIPMVDLFILTHGHADHVLGMDDLRRFCDLRGGTALPVFSTPEGLERVAAVFPYAIGDRPQYKGYPAFSLQPMPPTLELPQGRIEHTLLPHAAYKSSACFSPKPAAAPASPTTPTAPPYPRAAEQLARGADIAVLDGLRPRPHPTHMSIPDALAAAARIGARRTYLTHMTLDIDHDPAQSLLPDNIYYAWDGLRIDVASPR